MEYIDLCGNWTAQLEDGSTYSCELPGTLDENNIGYPDKYIGKLYQDENYVENSTLASQEMIATRFTRKFTYEGEAIFLYKFEKELPIGKRYFVEVERARDLRLFVDGKEVPALRGSLSTPYCFEVTDCLKNGSEIKFVSDNSYKNLPHDNILYSSAATDETQTNWNGLTGFLRIRIEDETFIDKVLVYAGNSASIKLFINSQNGFEGTVSLSSAAFQDTVKKEIAVQNGIAKIEITDIALNDIQQWDEYKGNLYTIEADLFSDKVNSKVTASFGCRVFGDDGCGHLALNGRRIFLRSEANCCVHPETGHAPTDVESWKRIINTYMGYGINSLRFHSHCPPEAAFEAADELGILLQPELSHWNPVDAFGSQKARDYYEKELKEIIYQYGNHPSFVMLTFGNELQADEEGLAFMHGLIDMCHEMDDTRLYAIGSNVFYGEKGCDENSDFYTSMMYKTDHLRATFDGMRGFLNNDYPNASHNFNASMAELRKAYKKPVFSFEVGQYEVLPDFDEIDDFKGVTIANNYKLIRDKVVTKGYADTWKKRVEATGELSLLCYREEVEAALRTEDFSGISLLGLQDFPGQGTALVGMLNSHLNPKPYSFAKPERFRSFFRPVLPLVYLEKYTYTNREKLVATVKLANYSDHDVDGKLEYRLVALEQGAAREGIYESSNLCDAVDDIDNESKSGEKITCSNGKLTDIGVISIDLSLVKINTRFNLEVTFGTEKNTYPIWVYVDEENLEQKEATSKENDHSPEAGDLVVSQVLDDSVINALKAGKNVYLTPPSTKESFPDSIKSTFSTDFWSVGTFASQEGSMGLLIDEKHPLFKNFPTESHTDYQWWVTSGQRAIILPEGVKSIVTVMDSYAYMRNMGQILEFKCLNGKVFLSSLGLQDLQEYPECRALQSSIYDYMGSADFDPEQEISEDALKLLIKHA